MVSADSTAGRTATEYASAIGNREIAYVQSSARMAKSSLTLSGPGTYQPTREKKLKALQCYLTMIQYLLPTDTSIQSSSLWHKNLSAENIFVDTEDHAKVVGIIDWQATNLAPLYETIPQPWFLNHEGPQSTGLEQPELPSDYADLEPSLRRVAYDLYLKQSFCALYRGLVHNQIPRLHRTLSFQKTDSYSLLWIIRNLSIDGEATYPAKILDIENEWADLPGVLKRGNPPYPFQFSEEERSRIWDDSDGALEGMKAMEGV